MYYLQIIISSCEDKNNRQRLVMTKLETKLKITEYYLKEFLGIYILWRYSSAFRKGLFDKTKRRTKIESHKAFIYDTVTNKYELFIQINYFVKHVRQAVSHFDIKLSFRVWGCRRGSVSLSPFLYL